MVTRNKAPKETVQQAIGRRLREIRTLRGISQDTFADDIRMHRTYYSAIERGEKNLTLSTLTRLTDAFGVTLSGLLMDAGF